METTTKTEQIREVVKLLRSEKNLSLNTETVKELMEKMEDECDFYLTIDGEELRFIAEDSIREIAQEEIWSMVEECYLTTGKEGLPWWIAIDQDKTVQNCIDADGYGHHFSGYDGNEYETGDWYIFRTN